MDTFPPSPQTPAAPSGPESAPEAEAEGTAAAAMGSTHGPQQGGTQLGGPRRRAGRRLPVVWRALTHALTPKGLRSSELSLALLSVPVGIGVGLAVAGLHALVLALHSLAFKVPFGDHISSALFIPSSLALAAPVVGGALLAGLGLLFRRARDTVDPIEANALYGGRMSLRDSLRLTLSIVVSHGAGGSVGMEAAFTQTGAGMASNFGRRLNLRRNDLRTLVGCGAAAAISAAFTAPLAGAFYAFELVIGTYTMATLAPVCVAAVVANQVAQMALNRPALFILAEPPVIRGGDFATFLLVGLAAGALAILTMQAVTHAERLFRQLPIPRALHPVLGGLLLGPMALVLPGVLGGGQGALQYGFDHGYGLGLAFVMLVAKVVASALCLGAGFRGGLFSASLLLGSLFGSMVSDIGTLLPWDLVAQRSAVMLVGMGSFAAAVVGAPVTMVLLVLELTGDLRASAGVLMGVIASTLLVRETFGYSFATWRFHQRGVQIRGGHDIGWVKDMTVGRLMRGDPKTVPADISLGALRGHYPPGSAKTVFALDPNGAFAGRVDMNAVHDPQHELPADQRAAELARDREHFLLPDQSVRMALQRFADWDADSLPVVEGVSSRRVVGYLTEAYALRRYSQELERRRGDELGVRDLFGGV
ncbi:chloride channel protein [Nitrospirillum viridazoti]|nr:chloride channel protein [Nitrospirillum amazonense]